MFWTILYRVCECKEELKQELRHVNNERDQMSGELMNPENAFIDVKRTQWKIKINYQST